jgi:Fuc2NAc and GlcNAc transferase
MGDVGSGFLGFAFCVLAVLSERSGAVPLAVWMMLLGVFVFDATATLLRRVLNGEHFFEAHRRHAYQRAVQSGLSHGRVSGGVLAVNLALAGAAAVACSQRPLILPIAAVSLAALLALYLWVERRKPMWD